MRGNMTLVEFGLYNWRGGGGSMWFGPVSQAKGSETCKQVELATHILNKHGLDYVGEFIVGQRAMHHLIDVLFDRTDPEEMKAAYACFNELLNEFTKHGYGVYRVNPEFMHKVVDSFGPTQCAINKTLKPLPLASRGLILRLESRVNGRSRSSALRHSSSGKFHSSATNCKN